MLKISDKNKLIIRGIIVFLFFWFSSYLQLIPIKLLGINLNSANGTIRVLLSAFSSIIVMFVLFLIYRKDLVNDFKKFKSNFLKNIDAATRYWFIGLIIMVVSNIIITFVLKAGGANNEHAVQEMIKDFPAMMFVLAGVIAPFNEEIVFRKSIKDIVNNKWLFVFISFLLFGGAHVIGSATSMLDYLYVIPYGILGASFALAYDETDTIFTSITMHIIHNSIMLILSIFVI